MPSFRDSRLVGKSMRPLIFAGAMLGLLMVLWLLFPADEWIRSLTGWIEGLGAWGIVLFGTLYVLGTVLMAPGSILSMAAGLAFGISGIPIVVIAATVGATFAFLIGRYGAQTRVRKAMRRYPKLQAVDRAIGESGWKVVFLLRLSPVVPFNLQNYFFGVTDVGLLPYSAATLVGIVPGTALYVWLGAIGRAAGQEDGIAGEIKWAFFGLGLIATVIATVLVTRNAQARLQRYGVSSSTAD